MVKITGQGVITEIFVDPAQQAITKGPNEGQPYYRARYGGLGFTVTEQFYTDWKAGSIAEVNLAESSYEVVDPMDPTGPKIVRQSWQMSAYGTYEQLVTMETNQLKISTLRTTARLNAKAAEMKIMKDLQLDAETMKALMATI